MASDNLINTVNGYEDYIRRKGIDEQVIDAYCMASLTAMLKEKDEEYGMKLIKANMNQYLI